MLAEIFPLLTELLVINNHVYTCPCAPSCCQKSWEGAVPQPLVPSPMHSLGIATYGSLSLFISGIYTSTLQNKTNFPIWDGLE